jgi:Na+-translocating ferredoxin:NAD+ oxidoreductase RnfC subunit
MTPIRNGMMIFPDDIPAINVKKRTPRVQLTLAASACCQCTRCTDLCPRALLGYPLEPHRMVRTSLSVVAEDPQAFTEAALCCGCGICEIAACCQSISPRIVISEMKQILSKNKLRFTADREYTPDPQREYRMLPSDRWMEMLGVKKFDRLPPLSDGVYRPTRVTLTMKGHIGAPSIPAVKVGDSVKIGDKIADAAEGLSLPQFAPISGKVSFVDGEKIIIEE